MFWDTAGFTSVPCDVSGVTFSGNTVNGCVGSGGCARVPVQRHDTATHGVLCAGSQATKARALRRCKRIRAWRCGNQCITEAQLTRFCAPPCTGVACRPSFNATMWVLSHALAPASPVVGTPSVSATTSVVPGQALPPITVRGATVYVGVCPRLQRRPRLTRARALRTVFQVRVGGGRLLPTRGHGGASGCHSQRGSGWWLCAAVTRRGRHVRPSDGHGTPWFVVRRRGGGATNLLAWV